MIEEQPLKLPARLVDTQDLPEDRTATQALRPERLSDFVGQTSIKQRLDIAIQAARERTEPLDHVLFSGPPGLGKTTLSTIIAREMGSQVHVTSGLAIERPGDLASILTKLQKRDVLFIDEIHRLNRGIEEVLYTAMEDYRLDIIVGKGPSAQTLQIDLPPFTLVGATTRTGLLTGPLRARFGHHFTLEYYTPEDLGRIIRRSADLLGMKLEPDAALELSGRSRGTPRVANRLLRRVRDFAQVHRNEKVDLDVVKKALHLLGIDEIGLDALDRQLMALLVHRYRGTPVGLKNLAVSLGEDPHTLEEVYEPYLIQIGLVTRTPRGRMATQRAVIHFGGGPEPTGHQQLLPL